MRRVILLTILPALLIGAVWATERQKPQLDDEDRIHPADYDVSALEIQRLFLHENYEPLRKQLGQLQRGMRMLQPDDGERYGAPAVAYSRGLHRGLSATRELVIDGEFDKARTEFIWVLDTCTGCHQTTREAGAGPDKPVR